MHSTALFATFTADKAWLVILLSAAMIVMAIVDFKYLKIHNKLTFPVIFAGWIYAFLDGGMRGASIDVYLPLSWLGLGNPVLFELHGWAGGAMQGLWHSLALSFLGLGLLVW